MIIKSLLKKVRKNSGSKLGLLVQRLAYAVYRESCNPGYNFIDNGEMRVIKIASKAFQPAMIFDVGANSGQWSKMCSQEFTESSQIYAFEPGSRANQKLSRIAEDIPMIQAFNIGLSDKECAMELLVSDTVSEKSSVEINVATTLHPRIKDFKRETSNFCTGDQFCESNKIASIDILKIDTEGHDLNVVRGFESMISNSRIKLIQFEYNKMNLLKKSLLFEFYDSINKQFTAGEYKIGRIYPKHVTFKDYSVYDENFVDGNFVAVHKAEKDLIKALQG